MNVSVNRINLNSTGNVKAFAEILIEGWFVVKGIKVVEGENGLFVSMPNKKGTDGNYYDTANPITAEGREAINKVVLEAYEKATT